jgi:hypothetical protein
MRNGSSDGVTELDHGRYLRDSAYRNAIHGTQLPVWSFGRGLLPPTIPIHDHDRPGEIHISHDVDRACCQSQPWTLTIHQLSVALRISPER